CQHYYSTPCSC
nr:immunoglobulin light chain junction region [Macaca mulatta]